MSKGRKTKVSIAAVTYGDCSFQELTLDMIQLLSINRNSLSKSGAAGSSPEKPSYSQTASQDSSGLHVSRNEAVQP